MSETLSIAIPMAGYGTRMRPHTWSKPKPLIFVAGKTVLDHVIDQFKTLPAGLKVEWVLIISPHQEAMVKDHMRRVHPEKKVHYVLQEQMNGQSEALFLARDVISGPMLMSFSDTLIDTDLSSLMQEKGDGIAWVKAVPDPRRFGVAEVGAQQQVKRLIEKPQSMENNLAVVGFYYFRSAEMLMTAIKEQMERGISLKGEYFLTDAINLMLEKGASFRVQIIDTWLDAGIPAALLETNRYYLEHGAENSSSVQGENTVIVPPVYIAPGAQVNNSIIGPNVSVGKDCRLKNSIIRNSIIDSGSEICGAFLENSLIGREVQIIRAAERLNLGDNSCSTLGEIS